MGEINVSDIKDGDILKRAIRSENGEEILAEGTVLRTSYIEALNTLGITYIDIERGGLEEKEGSAKTPITIKQIEIWAEQLQGILEQHVYKGRNTLSKIKILADLMQQELEEKNFVHTEGMIFQDIYQHTIMVTIYAYLLMKANNCKETEKYDMLIGSLLHDIGIRYITVEYMNRDIDEMSPKEIFEYKKHTIFGYTALETEQWISERAKRIVLSHHERLDGSGYPLKQKNQEIECQIIQIVDHFLTRTAGIACIRETPQHVLEDMKKRADIEFNRDLLEKFNKIW